MSVTPVPGTFSQIATGGTPVNAVPANPNGGFITNPSLAADQGLSEVETLYVNPVTDAGLAGNGTTFAIEPGQTWFIIPGQSTPTSVNAATSNHKFAVVYW